MKYTHKKVELKKKKSSEKKLKKKKNNQKTKQAREKEIMFLFLTPRFRKKDYN